MTTPHRPIRALGEIALRVRDLDGMQAFYQDVVGLELMRRFPGSAFFRIAQGVAGHTQVLALFDRSARDPQPPAAPASALDHLAFGIALADLASEQQRLERLGIEVTTTTHAWTQWRSLYVRDPEGNVVEWVCHDASVPTSGSTPAAPPARRAAPEPLVAASIRLAADTDAGAIADIYRPAVTDSATSFELEPPDAQTIARRVVATLARTPWLVCVHGGAVAGYAYAGVHRERLAYQWTAEVSAYVQTAAQRRGVARALYESLFEVLVLQGFRNAVAGIALPNPASVGLHAALGFTPVGVYRGIGFKFGRWHDVAWFERELGVRAGAVPAPRPLPEVVNDPSFTGCLAAGEPCIRLGSAS